MDAADLIPQYANSGMAVFPLHAMKDGHCTCWRDCGRDAAKHPLLGLAHGRNDPLRSTCRGECGRLGHGLHDATTDLGQIAEWLAAYPGCNWGVRPPVGVIVVDVDPRNNGDASLAKLELQHGPLPPTLTAKTGGGGWHYWLGYNGPTRGKLAEGVDIKGNSGYVVAPPSNHASGGVYEWLDMRPAAHAPGWVKAIMNPPIRRRPPVQGGGQGSGQGLISYVESKKFGEINDAVYWAACRANETGILDNILEDLVAAAARAAGSQATAAGEVQTRKTIESARNAPPRPLRATRPPSVAEFLHGRTTV